MVASGLEIDKNGISLSADYESRTVVTYWPAELEEKGRRGVLGPVMAEFLSHDWLVLMPGRRVEEVESGEQRKVINESVSLELAVSVSTVAERARELSPEFRLAGTPNVLIGECQRHPEDDLVEDFLPGVKHKQRYLCMAEDVATLRKFAPLSVVNTYHGWSWSVPLPE